jgi:hypothetical protein
VIASFTPETMRLKTRKRRGREEDQSDDDIEEP